MPDRNMELFQHKWAPRNEGRTTPLSEVTTGTQNWGTDTPTRKAEEREAEQQGKGKRVTWRLFWILNYFILNLK